MKSRTYQNSYAGLVALSNQPTAWVWAAIGILVLALMPTLFGSFGLNMLTAIFVASIGVLGLNLLSGVAGQISLGHAGFLLIGAYAQAILTTDYKVPSTSVNQRRMKRMSRSSRVRSTNSCCLSMPPSCQGVRREADSPPWGSGWAST